MKYSLLSIIAISILAGCNQTSTKQAENIAIVETYIKAVEAKDYETMKALLDDDYLGLGPSIYDSIGKEAALVNWQDNIENLYESIDYERSQNAAVTITSGDNQGEWVSNWAQLKIIYKNNKGTVVIWANTTYKVENGKVVRSFTFYNEADALRQLGYVFINPNNL